MRPRSTIILASAAVLCAALAFVSGPAYAGTGTAPSGTRVTRTSETVGLSAGSLKDLKKLTSVPSGTVPAASAAVVPACDGEDWEDLDLELDWEYSDDTGITFASQASWDGFATCTGMSVPPECSVPGGTGRTVLCTFETDILTIPLVNF
jgi:hypothetical protein